MTDLLRRALDAANDGSVRATNCGDCRWFRRERDVTGRRFWGECRNPTASAFRWLMGAIDGCACGQVGAWSPEIDPGPTWPRTFDEWLSTVGGVE